MKLRPGNTELKTRKTTMKLKTLSVTSKRKRSTFKSSSPSGAHKEALIFEFCTQTVRDFMSLQTGARVNIILKFSVHTFPSIQLPCRSTGWQPRDSSHKGHIM